MSVPPTVAIVDLVPQAKVTFLSLKEYVVLLSAGVLNTIDVPPAVRVYAVFAARLIVDVPPAAKEVV